MILQQFWLKNNCSNKKRKVFFIVNKKIPLRVKPQGKEGQNNFLNYRDFKKAATSSSWQLG